MRLEGRQTRKTPVTGTGKAALAQGMIQVIKMANRGEEGDILRKTLKAKTGI